jgi:hypothetical protein
MRMMMHVTFPHEPFSAAVKDGSIGGKMKRILDQQKPEAAYYTASGGRRSAFLIVELTDASKIPWFAEPWFLTFNADIELNPVMNGQDLAAAGLEGLGKAWA